MNDLQTLNEVMNDVWTPAAARGASLTLELNTATGDWRVIAYRHPGDFWERNEVTFTKEAIGDDPRGFFGALDTAIQMAVDALQNLTVSQALEAGERRRCQSEDNLDRDLARVLQRARWREKHLRSR